MRILSAGLCLVLAACAGGPAPADWQINAPLALKGFEKAYFSGNTRAAEIEFARARNELSATGRADLVARAELVRCAVRTAALEFDDCPGYRALEADAGSEERAYAAYLVGGGERAQTADPLSRLVAAGVLLRSGKIAPAGIAAAIETASDQGWRRPLLAWLGVEEKRAFAAGDADAAARIRRRIALVSGDSPGGREK